MPTPMGVSAVDMKLGAFSAKTLWQNMTIENLFKLYN